MIIAAGHICLDISPALDQPASALRPGNLIETGAARFVPGGAVGNVGCALRALGADVRLMSLIGDDEIGDILYSILNKRGLTDGLNRTNRAGTSYTFVIAPPDTDRIFLHHPGLNEMIGPDDMDMGVVRSARLFHFGYPTLMKRFQTDGGEGLARMFKAAREAGALTSLDLTLFDDDAPAARVPWRDVLGRALPYVDFFLPSAEEICKILEPGRLAEWRSRAGGGDIIRALDIPGDVEPLADQLITLGAKVVMIKCGERGLFLKGASYMLMKDRQMPLCSFADARIIQPALQPPTPIVSAAGAGDMCIAAFLHAALSGYNPSECLWFGAAAGSLSTTAYDGASALIPLEDMRKIFIT